MTLEVSEWSPAFVIMLLSSYSTTAWGSSTTMTAEASPSSLSWLSKKPSSTEVHRTFCFLRPIASRHHGLDENVFSKERRLLSRTAISRNADDLTFDFSPVSIADNSVGDHLQRKNFDSGRRAKLQARSFRRPFLYHIKSRTECFSFVPRERPLLSRTELDVTAVGRGGGRLAGSKAEQKKSEKTSCENKNVKMKNSFLFKNSF